MPTTKLAITVLMKRGRVRHDAPVQNYLRVYGTDLKSGEAWSGWLAGYALLLTLSRAKKGDKGASINNATETLNKNLGPRLKRGMGKTEIPLGDSNPCFRRERPMS